MEQLAATILSIAHELVSELLENEWGTVVGKLNMLGFIVSMIISVSHAATIEVFNLFNRLVDIFDRVVCWFFEIPQPIMKGSREGASTSKLFVISLLGLVVCISIVSIVKR